MEKQVYEKPTMNIVMLQQQTHLLAGSQVGATMDNTWDELVL